MAHFAELDESNVVINVIYIHNVDCLDQNGNESEEVGINFLRNLFGVNRRYVQTSYNNNIRRDYARIGGFYDPVKDIFVGQQPYPSWTLNQDSYWEPPIPFPDDGEVYNWDEENQQWVLV